MVLDLDIGCTAAGCLSVLTCLQPIFPFLASLPPRSSPCTPCSPCSCSSCTEPSPKSGTQTRRERRRGIMACAAPSPLHRPPQRGPHAQLPSSHAGALAGEAVFICSCSLTVNLLGLLGASGECCSGIMRVLDPCILRSPPVQGFVDGNVTASTNSQDHRIAGGRLRRHIRSPSSVQRLRQPAAPGCRSL